MFHLRLDNDGMLWCPQSRTNEYHRFCSKCLNYAGTMDGHVHCNQNDDGNNKTTFIPPTPPDKVQIRRPIKLLKKNHIYVECPKPGYTGVCDILECKACNDHHAFTFSDVLCTYPDPRKEDSLS